MIKIDIDFCYESLPEPDPHIQLLAAILENALDDILKPNGDPKKGKTNYRTDAMRWFMHDGRKCKKDVGFTFVECCEALDICPDFLRRKAIELNRWMQSYVFIKKPNLECSPLARKQVTNFHRFHMSKHAIKIIL